MVSLLIFGCGLICTKIMDNTFTCAIRAFRILFYFTLVIITRAFIIITGLHSVMIFLDYRDCIRNNNNNDLLKYASLIIITDNRGGKRDRPLAVKHSFVVEFLTSRIFNIILPETLITALLKSPAIFTGHAESEVYLCPTTDTATRI